MSGFTELMEDITRRGPPIHENQATVCVFLFTHKAVSLSMFDEILRNYGLDPAHYAITPFGTGLINRTWKLSTTQKPCYILQQINTAIFKQPGDIAANIRNLGDYLQQHAPGYLFAGALPTQSGKDLYVGAEGRYFRLFAFIPRSHSIEVVQTPQEAFDFIEKVRIILNINIL